MTAKGLGSLAAALSAVEEGKDHASEAGGGLGLSAVQAWFLPLHTSSDDCLTPALWASGLLMFVRSPALLRCVAGGHGTPTAVRAAIDAATSRADYLVGKGYAAQAAVVLAATARAVSTTLAGVNDTSRAQEALAAATAQAAEIVAMDEPGRAGSTSGPRPGQGGGGRGRVADALGPRHGLRGGSPGRDRRRLHE